MRRGNTSKENLTSQARVGKIKIHVPQQVVFKCRGGGLTAHFQPLKYLDMSYHVSEVSEGVVRDFPIITKSNGEPWDLGNLYLMWKFSEDAKYDQPRMSTFASIANHLMAFLRWIEHSQSEGKDVHELYFPEQAQRRVTYQYHRYLKRCLRQRPQPISIGVAKARMSAVVGFYRGLVKGGLVAETAIENPPYESRVVGIPLVNSIGLAHIKSVESTDLSFKQPMRNEPDDVIIDGGALRPLSLQDQEVAYKYLCEHAGRDFQLIFLFALMTGARKQTIGTLRIKQIRDLLPKCKDAEGEVFLPVGSGTGIDAKQQSHGVGYRLAIPNSLVLRLIDYIDSNVSRERRAISFYGDTDENYVFLTKRGTPFYTSQREIKDRQNSVYSQRLSAKERVDFPISEGQSITNRLNRVIEKIQIDHPSFRKFRFHDLRASYGTNYVEDAVAANTPRNKIMNQLKARMGHAHVTTTLAYLDFEARSEEISKAKAGAFNRMSRLSQYESN